MLFICTPRRWRVSEMGEAAEQLKLDSVENPAVQMWIQIGLKNLMRSGFLGLPAFNPSSMFNINELSVFWNFRFWSQNLEVKSCCEHFHKFCHGYSGGQVQPSNYGAFGLTRTTAASQDGDRGGEKAVCWRVRDWETQDCVQLLALPLPAVWLNLLDTWFPHQLDEENIPFHNVVRTKLCVCARVRANLHAQVLSSLLTYLCMMCAYMAVWYIHVYVYMYTK